MRVYKIVAGFVLALIIIVAVSFITLLGAKDKESQTKVDVVIIAGESRAEIAQKLVGQNLIKSSFAFTLYSRFIGGKILPGTYELSPAQSGSAIAEQISAGRYKTVQITIIEGWRATDMEKYLVEEKKLTQLSGFAKAAQPYEGYLFPDTYEVKVDVTVGDLIILMRENFTTRTKALKINPEIVILASIVEREAKADSERSAIAGVYANRMKIGMRLQADPTVQYGKGDWKATTLGDYQSVISPYNTYLNDGLPPGPICSPGLKSIEAAISPAPHDYLYFFHAKGQSYFSKTLAEHQAKVRQNF